MCSPGHMVREIDALKNRCGVTLVFVEKHGQGCCLPENIYRRGELSFLLLLPSENDRLFYGG